MESPEVESPVVESAEVESPEVESAEVESPDAESSDVAPSDVEVAGAELMSPDLVDVGDLSSSEEHGQADELGLADGSYSDAADSALFGGDSLADELSRAIAVGQTGAVDGSGDLDTAERVRDAVSGDQEYDADFIEAYYGFDRPSRARRILRDLLTVAQLGLAVVFGAGLFLAFDQLWKWNSLVAMVLAILVTLGLVAGVWVVRKTEDIASTLIAVGVGLLVTFGPLALMQAG